uniref:Uncharacterized protein n=1 Tax=Arundo donax TaxID=35708 RepID=A0A0A9A7Y7_ARUDO
MKMPFLIRKMLSNALEIWLVSGQCITSLRC